MDLDVSLNGQRGGRGHGSQAVEIEVLIKVFIYLTHITTECENQLATSRPIAPWERNPYRLVSLLDLMQTFRPEEVLKAFRSLAQNIRMTKAYEGDAALVEAALHLFDLNLKHCVELCTSLELRVTTSLVEDAIRLRRLKVNYVPTVEQ